MISKMLYKLGMATDNQDWPDSESLEFGSLHGDETCKECGASCDSEYCHLCAPHMED